MQKLTAPTTDVHGPQKAGPDTLWFHHGVAYTDVRDISERFKARGYTVEQVAFIPPAHAAAVATAQAEPVFIGTPLRDAAVDPRPGDNPAGALTRQAQAKARGEQVAATGEELPQWR